MRHALRRTSPKGGPFVGACMNCGRDGLSLADRSDCPNPAGFSQSETLLRAIRGDDA